MLAAIDACIKYVPWRRQKVGMRPAGSPQARERRRHRAADSHSRGAAIAPLRLDGTRRLPPSGSTGRGVCPPPARLRAAPSRRLPLKGGVILERLMQASYHSPFKGESQKPSRQAKADAEGGGRRVARLRRGRYRSLQNRPGQLNLLCDTVRFLQV